MPGTRQPTDIILANGRKHLSRTEEEARRDREVRVPPAQKAAAPKWLPEAMRKEFRSIGKKLIALGLYSDLDADCLARYLVAHHQYLTATARANAALRAGDETSSDVWSRVQERYFKQARNCANDIGLTVTARCRLVLPQGMEQHQDDAPDDFTLRLLERQQRTAEGVS